MIRDTEDRKFMFGGFTLSEVLITIGIIGFVAIVVLSPLQRSSQERAYETARKKALASIGEAIRQIAIQEDINGSANAQDFVVGKLSKKITIIKTCANNKLTQCGISSKIKVPKQMNSDETVIMTMPKTMSALYTYNGPLSYLNTPSYGFVLNNGYSVNLFYNPNCVSGNAYYGSSTHKGVGRVVCVNAIYDMNGLKAPNQVGKDIGIITVFYPDFTSVAVAPKLNSQTKSKVKYTEAQQFCAQFDGYTLPSKEEALSIAFNTKILGNPGGYTWTHSSWNATQNWVVRTYGLELTVGNKNGNMYGNQNFVVFCVK